MSDRSQKKPKKRQTFPQADTTRTPGVSRITVRFGIPALLALGLVACWLMHGFGYWPLLQATRAMQDRMLEPVRGWLDVAERLHGDPASIALLRARLYRRMGDLPAMNRELERARASGADSERIRRERLLAVAQAGQLHEVESELRRWLDDPGEEGADLCDAYTNGLASQGRLTEASLLLDAWESGFPHDPKPHLKRGRMAEHSLQYELAEAEYRLALQKQPDYAEALYSLGRLLLDRKRPAEAIPQLRRCSEISPGVAPAARVAEASSLRLLGKDAEARTILEDVLRLDPQAQQQAYLQVGYQAGGAPAALELGKLENDARHYEEAEKWLSQAVTADPFDLDARYAWGVALRGLGRTQEAEKELEHVSRVRKELADTEVLQTHVAEHPDDVEARFKVARVYLQHQSPRVGIYWMQSVLAHDPHHQPTHRALAEYYEAHLGEVPSYASLAQYHRSQLRPETTPPSGTPATP